MSCLIQKRTKTAVKTRELPHVRKEWALYSFLINYWMLWIR